MKYIVQLSTQEATAYKSMLLENIDIYKKISTSIVPKDIGKSAIALRDQFFEKGAVLDGLVEMTLYENKWTKISYRILIAWLSITCQLWEQQLIQWVDNQIDGLQLIADGYKYPKSLSEVRDFLYQDGNGFDIRKFQEWKNISELRSIVNVIKHSEGNSEQALRKKRPELFTKEKSYIDGSPIEDAFMIKSMHTSIGFPVLEINDDDLEKYTNACSLFWDEFSQNSLIIDKGLKAGN